LSWYRIRGQTRNGTKGMLVAQAPRQPVRHPPVRGRSVLDFPALLGVIGQILDAINQILGGLGA